MRKSNKYSVILLIFIILLVSFAAFRFFIQRVDEEISIEVSSGELSDGLFEETEIVEEAEPLIIKNEEEKKKEVAVEKVELPEKFLIDVNFLSQAPFGVWDEYHDDACEEASLIMLEYYLSEKDLSNEVGESQIQGLIRFQIRNYGDFKDTSVAQTVQLASDFYDRKNLEVVYDFEKERIKEEIAKGNPVILPAAGRMLGNPYYTQPGPLYHNLIAIGYDGDMIITHDPGTRRGANYEYHIDVLYDAVHDFTGNKDDISSGRKAMIIVR